MSDDSAAELLDPAAAACIADALPTPEEIASAAAAAGVQRPSSLKEKSAAAAGTKGLGKGLGGAGLAVKRKAKGGSTISAATAPAALSVRRDLAAPSGSGGGSSRGSSAGPSRAGAAAAAGGAGSPAKDTAGGAASSGSGSVGGSRGLKEEAVGAHSFNLRLPHDSLDNEDEEWESASTDDEILELAMAGEAAASSKNKATAAAGSRKGPTAGKAAAAAASSGSRTPVGWQEWVEESFDASALLLAGGVLAVCVSSLLVLGGAAWMRSRSSC